MEVLYDYDVDCNGKRGCPKFVLDRKKGKISMQDRKGNIATMEIKEFNDFIDAVIDGKVPKV